MMAAKASLAEAKEKLRQAVLAQPPLLRNTISKSKPQRSAYELCKRSRVSRSISTAQQSAYRNWRGKPKPIVRSTKRPSPDQGHKLNKGREDECGQRDRTFPAPELSG